MKRILCLLLALCLLLPVVAMAEGSTAKLGVAYAAGHGNGVMVASVVVVDGVIVDAYIDEIYFTGAKEEYVLLPYASELGVKDEVTTVAISKRENHEVYSKSMVDRGGLDIADSYDIYQAFVIGKTIEELEAAVEGYTVENKTEFVDVVSGVTMVDTLLYINALLAAAHNAQ